MSDFTLTDEALDHLRQSQLELISSEAGTEPDQAKLDDLTFNTLVRSGGMIAKVVDESLREKGLPGLGYVEPDKFAKMGVIAFEEDLSLEMAKRALKVSFFSMCGSIAAANLIAARKMKGAKETEPEQQNDK